MFASWFLINSIFSRFLRCQLGLWGNWGPEITSTHNHTLSWPLVGSLLCCCYCYFCSCSWWKFCPPQELKNRTDGEVESSGRQGDYIPIQSCDTASAHHGRQVLNCRLSLGRPKKSTNKCPTVSLSFTHNGVSYLVLSTSSSWHVSPPEFLFNSPPLHCLSDRG